MTRSPRSRLAYILALLFAVAPLFFGLFRSFKTHTDNRMLWMAFASLAGAVAVMAVRTRLIDNPTGLTIAAFAVTTVPAAITAYLLGATAAAGVWGVAMVFGLCWAASFALIAYARPRTT